MSLRLCSSALFFFQKLLYLSHLCCQALDSKIFFVHEKDHCFSHTFSHKDGTCISMIIKVERKHINNFFCVRKQRVHIYQLNKMAAFHFPEVKDGLFEYCV